MKKLFRDKKTRGRNLALLLIPFIVMVIVFGILAINSVKSITGSIEGSGSNSFSNSIEEYDYHLRSNATNYQKELFTQLKDECNKTEKDDQKIAVLVAKNFVADFYTWTNKNGTTDVGGMYYVYSPNRKSILLQSRRYLYQYLNKYINEYGQNNLIEVESIEDPVDVKKSSEAFVIGIDLVAKKKVYDESKKYDTYSFRLNWKYVTKTGGFDSSQMATTSQFKVYKNADGRFEILSIGE